MGAVPAGAVSVARVPAAPLITLEYHLVNEFCHNYLFVKGFNATQAYLAIKPQVTPESASVQGSLLLGTDGAKAALAQMIKAAWERNELDQDFIVRNWVSMAQANVFDYFVVDAENNLSLKPTIDLTLDQQRNVRKLKITTRTIEREDAPDILEQRGELEIVDRKGVFDSMAKAAGLFGKLDTGEQVGDTAQLIERAFERVRKLVGARTFDNSTGAQIPDAETA